MNSEQRGRRGRRAVRRISAVTATVGITVAMAACTAGSPADVTPTPQARELVDEGPPASEPLESMAWGSIATVETLDPAMGTGYVDELLTNLCESLVRIDADGTIEPHLAESVDNPDPLTFVYTIREGVTFWDGAPMTADDVAYSLNRNLDENVGSHFATYFGNVASIDVTGEREVTIRMTQPDQLFPIELATFAGAVVQREFVESRGASFGTKDGGVMCTGPYTLESWTPESVVMTANPEYWKTDAPQKVETLNFRLIADEDTITSALLAGELDGATVYGTTAVTRLQSGTSGDLLLGKSTLSTQLIVTTREGPLQNPDVREALSLALPREGISSVAYAGTATPSKSLVSTIQPWAYGASVFEPYFEGLPPLSTDETVEQAREIIESADLPSNEISIAISSQFQEVSAIIVEAANAIGLDAESVTLNPAESVELYYDADLRGKYDAFILPWNTNVPDPLEMLIYFKPDGVYNYAGYDNPEYTALVDEALATADPDARAELVTQAVAILDADLPWIPIVDQPNLVYMGETVGGGPVSVFGRFWSQWGAYVAGR